MVEARVLAVVAPLLDRLTLHQARKCGADREHAAIEPMLGCMDRERNAVPDAAVYRCSNDRCGWERMDPLKR